MLYDKDTNGSEYVAWDVGGGGFKRAWIAHRTGGKDWAKTGRYLHVGRTESLAHIPQVNR